MTDQASTLAALQFGDSFFPSGATAFSWGLETLNAMGRVREAGEVAAFLRGQIAGRWAPFERPVVVAAHRAAADLEAVREIDHLVEAQSLASELRDGSRRGGLALLAVHEGLGTAGAAAYRALVLAGRAPGHGPVMQGLLWAAAGVAERDAELLSAHCCAVGLLGAALRLGAIGHLDAQRAYAAARPLVLDLLDHEAPDIESIGAFAPQAEIAVMRHETEQARLFAN